MILQFHGADFADGGPGMPIRRPLLIYMNGYGREKYANNALGRDTQESGVVGRENGRIDF